MALKTWNAKLPEADVVAIRSSRLIRLTSHALMSSTVSSSSLGVRPSGRINLEFLTAHSGTAERQIARPLYIRSAGEWYTHDTELTKILVA